MTVLATGLTKRFGDNVAVDALDLKIESGEVVVLVGRNGAGKTTTLRMLAGLLRPDAGSVEVEPVGRVVGYAAQELSLYPSVTARVQLEHFAALAPGLFSIDEVVDALELSPHLPKEPRELSLGQQRLIHVALACVVSGGVLLLDEPSAGVDVEARDLLLRCVRTCAERGLAVVYSTHYFEEVEQLDRRVAVIHHGAVVYDGSVADALQRHQRCGIQLVGPSVGAALAGFSVDGIGPATSESPEIIFVPVASSEAIDHAREVVLDELHRQQVSAEVRTERASFGGAFQALTGTSGRSGIAEEQR